MCSDAKVSGDKTIAIQEAKVGEHKLTVRLADGDDKLSSIPVWFSVSAEMSAAPEDAVFLPVVPTPKLRLDVKIPVDRVTASIKAEVGDVKAVRWSDAISGEAIVSATLKITRTDDKRHIEPLRVNGQIRAEAPAKVTKLATSIQSEESGEQSVEVELTIPQSGLGGVKRFDGVIELEFEPQSSRLSLFATNKLRVPFLCSEHLKPRIVPVKLDVVSTSASRWARLPDLCVFSVEVDVEVDGPLPPQTSLAAQSPANVKRLVMAPSVLRSGRQKIRLTCWATLPLKSTPNDFSFAVDVANPLPDRLQLTPSGPINVSVDAPPPMVIQDSEFRGALEESVADNASALSLSITPVVLDLADPAIANGSQVQIVSSATNQVVTTPLFIAKQIQIPIGAHTGGFFEGEDIEIVIDLQAESQSTGLLPSQLIVRIHRRSPFVRFFTYLTSILGPAIGCSLLLLAVRRFTNTEDIAFGDLENDDA